MPAFALEQPPQLASATASMTTRRSPTDPAIEIAESRSFGGVLEPRYIFRAESLDQ
jgi:hypothetical protein